MFSISLLKLSQNIENFIASWDKFVVRIVVTIVTSHQYYHPPPPPSHPPSVTFLEALHTHSIPYPCPLLESPPSLPPPPPSLCLSLCLSLSLCLFVSVCLSVSLTITLTNPDLHTHTNIASNIKEKAYKIFIRPLLEYAVSVWDPYILTEKHCQDRSSPEASGMLRPLSSTGLGTPWVCTTYWRRWAGLYCCRHCPTLKAKLVPLPSRQRYTHDKQLTLLTTRTQYRGSSFLPPKNTSGTGTHGGPHPWHFWVKGIKLKNYV